MKFLPLDIKGKHYRAFAIDNTTGEMESIDSDDKQEIYAYTEHMSRNGYEIDMYEWDYDIDMYIPF